MELEMLVRRAKKGDKDAFLELMLLHKEIRKGPGYDSRTFLYGNMRQPSVQIEVGRYVRVDGRTCI